MLRANLSRLNILDFSKKVVLLTNMDIVTKEKQSVKNPFRVGFLLMDNFPLMAYAAAVEPLRAANYISDKELYRIETISPSLAVLNSSSGMIIKADTYVGERVDFDLVLVLAAGGAMQFNDPRVFQWLRLLARRGVTLGGISGGAVILARAGLMHNRRMTTYWEYGPALTEEMPQLLLERAHYITDGDRMSCAGGIAALDMMHSLIIQHQGPEFARRVSDWFVHTEVRSEALPYRSQIAERYGTKHPVVIRAMEVMEGHIAEPLSLEGLAALVGIGPRQLNRLFQSELEQSTMVFYRDLRLEQAKNLVEHSAMSLTNIALATGFASSAHFSRCFRDVFNKAPSEFRK